MVASYRSRPFSIFFFVKNNGYEHDYGTVHETVRYLTRTSQKNSFPRSEQNQDIHDTSSELLILPEGNEGVGMCGA